ncbi:tetratricopeptide repeat protein [Nocardia crassostreae]|uniref:tetratricopeptide repeat protein n=1 Tax=Nocardia crassostreae TaxID=53428 RepID=UPI0014717DB6|nr:tetratricopeptide repeat protein [Nocardia crassostreae]
MFALFGLMAAVAGTAIAMSGTSSPASAPTATSDPLLTAITAQREQLERFPENAAGWAALGAAYVELARITGDPENYGEAQRALDRSIEIQPEGNAEALFGLGVLANALHNFTAARSYGEQALALRPDSAEVYGVLADAYTQLGEADAATAAVQRMLDLRPGVPSFTRAAYDLELHGRVDDARLALEMALGAAGSADQIAFTRYHLGELAFDSGRLDEAGSQYDAGLVASPENAALLQGQAKIAAARGDSARAIDLYTRVTAISPLPQYRIEFGELLESAGRPDAAADEYREVTDQQTALATQGVVEYLDAALFAADHGDPNEAVRLAKLEYDRRQSILTADALAWSLHKAGRNDEAIGYAEQAAALGWRSATLTYHRGMILAALGQTDRAVDTLTDALLINPHFSPLYAPRAQQTLDSLAGR